MVQGRSARSMLRCSLHKTASLPLGSNCLSERHFLLSFQLLQTCHHRKATQQLLSFTALRHSKLVSHSLELRINNLPLLDVN
jgi:hypothetical protein